MEYGEAVNEFEELFSTEMYEEVARAVQSGDTSVVVNFKEMDIFNPELAEYLKDNPQDAMNASEEAVEGVDIVSDEDLRVRFTEMPEEDFVYLRNLRSQHIGKFVPIEGMIKRASQVKPEVVSAIFECSQWATATRKNRTPVNSSPHTSVTVEAESSM